MRKIAKFCIKKVISKTNVYKFDIEIINFKHVILESCDIVRFQFLVYNFESLKIGNRKSSKIVKFQSLYSKKCNK